MLAAQADGHKIETIEALGQHPQKGWAKSPGLSAIQKAFVETGAIQCGYCTPAMILAIKSTLERQPDASEEEIRQALSGILCRCTGYKKPVQAALRASALLQGKEVTGVSDEPLPAPEEWLERASQRPEGSDTEELHGIELKTRVMPQIWTLPQAKNWDQVGKPEPRIDAIKLAQGKPAFTDDMEMRGMLYAKILTSPVAHAAHQEDRHFEGQGTYLAWLRS